MANSMGAAGQGGTGEKTKGRVGEAKEKLTDAKDAVQEKASHLAADAKHKGEDLLDEGAERARELTAEARDAARSKADREMHRLSGGIRTVAEALRRGSSQLGEDQRQYQPLVNGVARRVENLSNYIEERDVDDLSRDMRRFARNHAPLFLGGAFALGVLGARFLKSSGSEAQRARLNESSRYSGDGYTGYGYGSTGAMGRSYEGVPRQDRTLAPQAESRFDAGGTPGGVNQPSGGATTSYDAGAALGGSADGEAGRGGRNA